MVTKAGEAKGKFNSNEEPWLMFKSNDPWLAAFGQDEDHEDPYMSEAIYHLQADELILVGLPIPLAQRYVRWLYGEGYISDAVLHEKLADFEAHARQ